MNSNHYNPSALVKWRNEAGQTQDQIARELSVDRNTISRAETGKNASFELLTGLCKLYGKTMHELIHSEPAAAK